jgi:hypothetical protein
MTATNDIVTKRVLYNPALGAFGVYRSETIWWRKVGFGGVLYNDPRRRQLSAFIPALGGTYYLFLKASDLMADLTGLLTDFTDVNAQFVPPATGQPFDYDYWQPYYLPLISGWTEAAAPILYTSPIKP